MPDDVFYVGALDRNQKLSGLVPARFLTIKGQPVVDPTPGGPKGHIPYISSDAQGSNKSDKANPNNYMIVPANFNETYARTYADKIADIQRNPIGGSATALAKMFFDFKREGAEDIQRGPQWGIPEGSTVPAFASGASHYLGFVSGLTGIPLEYSYRGGGLFNRFGEDKSGPDGISQQNYKNLLQGWSDATTTYPPAWLADNANTGSQGQSSFGQIGGGGLAGWISTLQGIDPQNPTQPAAPQKASGPLGLISNQPMPDWPIPPPIFNTR
jgi:hypothetical protein